MLCAKKIIFGQFFTSVPIWLRPHIKEFILGSRTTIAYDPFAGQGDLLSVAQNSLQFNQIKGLDIDPKLNWEINDSLLNIPHINNAIIITNPPYLSNYSASRKKIQESVKKYFSFSMYDDLYLIALDKMLKAQDFVVAIVPETFINSNFKLKNRLVSITVLEENPFKDTDTPVVVLCFDDKYKTETEIKVYKNDTFINDLETIENCRIFPQKTLDMDFNDKSGWLGVRCVDTTDPNETLKFDFKENITYDWNVGIKSSSRLLTLVQVNVPKEQRQTFIDNCNNILYKIRKQSDDIILSPFKGNMKNGKRRRRLDFLTCRAIIEKAYFQTVTKKKEEMLWN